MRVVVFLPRGETVRQMPVLESANTITFVCWSQASSDADVIAVAESRVGTGLTAVLSRTLPGRMLTRMLPLDTGVRFWRATARSEQVSVAVRGADLIVAADRDAGFAVWKWLRRCEQPRPAAVRGFAAARAWIARRQS